MVFKNVLDLLEEERGETAQSTDENKSILQESKKGLPFNIKEFSNELHRKSEKKNKEYIQFSQNITAHDISRCIRQILYRIRSTEIPVYADKWLPMFMRTIIGSSIHKFIQDNTSQFTEIEVKVKVPSLRFSGVIDGIIGNCGLVEIKSCTYSDYKKIIKSKKPRIPDFYQMLAYKYVLENFLPEIKENNKNLRQNRYEIKFLQFIYVAHDIISADIEDFSSALEIIRHTKKLLNSKEDDFFFMTSLILEPNNFDFEKYESYIRRKIDAINNYLNNNIVPSLDDEFINKGDCYFCLYNQICNNQ